MGLQSKSIGTKAIKTEEVHNIYLFPPKKLAESESELRKLKKNIIFALKDSQAAESLLALPSITAEEVAGFVLSITGRIESILTRVRDNIPDDKRPRTLNITLRCLGLAITALSDERKPDVSHELYYVITGLLRHLENLKNIFSRVDDTVADFDKALICDKFLQPLIGWFSRMSDWCDSHEESMSSADYFPYGLIR